VAQFRGGIQRIMMRYRPPHLANPSSSSTPSHPARGSKHAIHSLSPSQKPAVAENTSTGDIQRDNAAVNIALQGSAANKLPPHLRVLLHLHRPHEAPKHPTDSGTREKETRVIVTESFEALWNGCEPDDQIAGSEMPSSTTRGQSPLNAIRASPAARRTHREAGAPPSQRPAQRPPTRGPFTVPDPAEERAKQAALRKRARQMLPEHLRNVPRPELWLERKLRAEAALKATLGSATARERCPTANGTVIQSGGPGAEALQQEAFPEDTFEADPVKAIVQEFAKHEAPPEEVLNDNESDPSDILEVMSRVERLPMHKKRHWRWFDDDNGSVATDRCKNGWVNDEIFDERGNWRPAIVEWDTRPQFSRNTSSHIRLMEAWLNDRVLEALSRPLLRKTSSEGFRSGLYPASGLRHHFQDQPGDCAPSLLIHYGPIPWHDIETLPPKDPYSRVEHRRQQTSHGKMEEYIQRSKMREKPESPERQTLPHIP
jgi:hypothetical protein